VGSVARQELADSIRSDLATERHRFKRTDERFCPVAQIFWRGSYDRSAQFGDCQCVDPAHMVARCRKVTDKVAQEGKAVGAGRGAPGFSLIAATHSMSFFARRARRNSGGLSRMIRMNPTPLPSRQ